MDYREEIAEKVLDELGVQYEAYDIYDDLENQFTDDHNRIFLQAISYSISDSDKEDILDYLGVNHGAETLYDEKEGEIGHTLEWSQACVTVLNELKKDEGFMSQLYERVGNMSGEGQARTFGCWAQQTTKPELLEWHSGPHGEWDIAELKEELVDFSDEDELWEVCDIGGGQQAWFETESQAVAYFVDDHIDGEQVREIFGMFI